MNSLCSDGFVRAGLLDGLFSTGRTCVHHIIGGGNGEDEEEKGKEALHVAKQSVKG